VHYEGYNIMMPSLLSALPMATSAVESSHALVAQVIIIIIYTSSVLMLPLQPNQSAFGTFLRSNEQIAFYSDKDGNQKIYVMNAADGTSQTRLTNNTAIDSEPNW
jgi:hypothetical protein